MVPGAGLEPACPLQTGDFKSPMYTISSPGQLLNSCLYYTTKSKTCQALRSLNF